VFTVGSLKRERISTEKSAIIICTFNKAKEGGNWEKRGCRSVRRTVMEKRRSFRWCTHSRGEGIKALYN